MILHKSNKYCREYKNILMKHQKELIEAIEKIEKLLIECDNFQVLNRNPFYKIYHFEKLVGDRQGYYSVRIGGSERIILKPNIDEPYNFIEIDEIIMEEINTKHYKK